MFGSVILDIAIGLSLVYLLLSLLSSVINEWIAALARSRAKFLEQGICNLITDEKTREAFYNHALIQALHRARFRPDYIPAQTFALALLDTIALRGVPAGNPVSNPKGFDDVRSAIVLLPQPIQEALLPLVDQAGSDLKRVRENVENWFNNTMDRVSEWYKRRSQKIIVALAVGVTLITNADSVFMAQTLSRDPTLRASILAAAQDYVRENRPDKTPNPPAGKEGAKAPPNVTKLTEALDKLQLPIGWSVADDDPRRVPFTDGFAVFSVWLLAKIFGLFVTVVAVSLGAPFWFDVLNKFVNFRSSVKPADKAKA